MRFILVTLFFGLCSQGSFAQTLALATSSDAPAPAIVADLNLPKKGNGFNNPERKYHINWKVDAPIIAVGTAWSLYAFPKIYDKDPIDSARVVNLDKADLNVLDRWAAGKTSDKADAASNYLFYGSLPLPALLFIDRRIRKDAAQVGILYWEAFAITGLIYTGCDYFIDRIRPETYNKDIPLVDRTNGNNKNAFPAGHVALVGTATFFTARVFADYHPKNPWRWAVYGFAAAATGTTAYLRHRAGKHFPTDIVAGALVGIGSGMLVPRLHRNRNSFVGSKLHLGPSMQGNTLGISAVYRF